MERVVSKSYDLVILDLMLPNRSGVRICQQLRTQPNYTPVMMLTAKSSEVDRVSGRNLIKEGRVDDKAIKKLFNMLMEINPTIEIYLLDANGTILAFSAPREKVKRTTVSMTPIEAFLKETTAFPLVGDEPLSAMIAHA